MTAVHRAGRWLAAGGLTVLACTTAVSVPSVPIRSEAGPDISFDGRTAADGECQEGVTRWVTTRAPALDRLAADQVWGQAAGDGVVVAVVDGGVSAANAHFPPGTVLEGKSFVEGPATADSTAHGTAIAGQIAARSIGSQSAVVGLAKEAIILPVKITDGRDQDNERITRLADGIRWAADNGARVMNLSLSTPSDIPAIREATAYAVAKDIVVVASACNRSTASETSDGMRYPAGYPGVIGVAAADASDVVTEDSIHGPQVSLTAPGHTIVSTFRDWGDCVFGANGESTSFATAYVSAAAAVLRSRFPEASAAEITHRLEVTAARAKRTERDDVAGWGMVQPFEAMTLIYDSSVGGPAAPGQSAAPRATPAPESLDLSAVPDPGAADRAATLWLVMISGALVLGLAMVRMIRQRRDTEP